MDVKHLKSNELMPVCTPLIKIQFRMSEKFLNVSKHQKLILNVNMKGVKANITNLYGSVAHRIALWPKIDIRVYKYKKKISFFLIRMSIGVRST